MNNSSNEDSIEKMTIGIVGLGYVGLPLACLFAQKYSVIGFDIDTNKIEHLQKGIDLYGVVEMAALEKAAISFTSDSFDLSHCHVIIVAVPTGVDENNTPDLSHLIHATKIIATILRKGMTVVFESTVYPGLTEEICLPILESNSNLQWLVDFNIGYSPERINPGDTKRPLHKIVKIVSGDSSKTIQLLSNLYSSVIEAGVYEAQNIKVAEAAKVIENAQRDLNIAFVNELAVIFDRMNIDTKDVLKAASTKWNFLPFEPGLVGGHCICIDPYYLTHKALELGYSPQVIHSGRHLNNQMGKFIAEKIIKALIAQNRLIADCKVLLLGCSFKENVADTRNSKVFDIVKALEEFQINVQIVDPVVANFNYNIGLDSSILHEPKLEVLFDAIVLAVKHEDFKDYSLGNLRNISKSNELNLFDIKGFYSKDEAVAISKFYWRL